MSIYGQRRTEQQLREEIIRVCRLIWERGWIAATAGNVSARLSKNRILTTPSGFGKGLLQPEQLIIVDMDGQKVPSYDAADGIAAEEAAPTNNIAIQYLIAHLVFHARSTGVSFSSIREQHPLRYTSLPRTRLEKSINSLSRRSGWSSCGPSHGNTRG